LDINPAETELIKIVKIMMDFIAYADGTNDLIDISHKIKVPVQNLYPIVEKLTKVGLLTSNNN